MQMDHSPLDPFCYDPVPQATVSTANKSPTSYPSHCYIIFRNQNKAQLHSGRLSPCQVPHGTINPDFSAAYMEDPRLTQPVLCWDQLAPAAKSPNCAHLSPTFLCYLEIGYSRSIYTTKKWQMLQTEFGVLVGWFQRVHC